MKVLAVGAVCVAILAGGVTACSSGTDRSNGAPSTTGRPTDAPAAGADATGAESSTEGDLPFTDAEIEALAGAPVDPPPVIPPLATVDEAAATMAPVPASPPANTAAQPGTTVETSTAAGTGTPTMSTKSLPQTTRRFGNYFVVLGDSYSAGEGAGDYATDHPGCDVSKRSHAATISASLNLGYYQEACQGALAKHVVSASYTPGKNSAGLKPKTYPKQIQTLRSRVRDNHGAVPRFVVFSAGGNDLGFSAVLMECVKQHLHKKNRCKKLLTRAERNTGTHRKRVEQAIDAIQAASPRSKVIVMGYPSLFALHPKGRTCAVNAPTGHRIAKLTAKVNGAAKLAADQNSAYFVSTTPSFDGHRLCDGNGSNDWFNALKWGALNNLPTVPVVGNEWKAHNEPGHPKADGYVAMGNQVVACVRNLVGCRAATISNRSSFPKNVDGTSIPTDGVEPETPVAAPSTPAGVKALKNADGSVTVTWSPVAGSEGYRVYASAANGDDSQVADSDEAATATVDADRVSGGCYVVVAVTDLESPPSAQACITGGTSGAKPDIGEERSGVVPYQGTPASEVSLPSTAPVDDTTSPTLPVASHGYAVTTNAPPRGTAQTNGACRGVKKQASFASLTTDPEGRRLSKWVVTSTSFGRSGFQFTNTESTGGYAFTIPTATPTGTLLTISWRAYDDLGAASPVVVQTYRASSC